MSLNLESDVRDLEDVLDRLEESARGRSCILLGQMLETVGRRSFAPVLLVVGLIALSPLSGIPGMPTALGILVFLMAVQLLMQRDHFWLPQWILKREVSHDKLLKAIHLLRKPARGIDCFLRPRLTFLTRHLGAYVILSVCALIGVTMPPLELLPFVATAAGAALSTFALALIGNDGVVALIGMTFTATMVGLAIYGFM